MYLTRQIKIQLAIFIVLSIVAGGIMIFGYLKAPTMLFGVGRYNVTVELPRAGGLYAMANVTYRGTEVGRVEDVQLTDDGLAAVLSLKSDIKIPSNLDAEVHSASAVGEQYVALLPRDATSPSLEDGDVIPLDRASVPPDINGLLDATNRGLQAIPQESLHTAINEGYIAFAGLGPDIARFVKGSTRLAIEARENLDAFTTLIDESAPVLNSQADSSKSIQAWAANLAEVTDQLRINDDSVAGLIEKGGPAADEARTLMERLQPTLPVLLANLVSIGDVAVAYQPALEQLLVLFPQAVANSQAGTVANLNTDPNYKALFLDFNLNINLPPVCTTGFLPAQQHRSPALEDYPERTTDNLYCRVPQDAQFNVRGARNVPCMTVPGKRAATVAECESDREYVPLNDGYNWKGDPNSTLSGLPIPEPIAGAPPPATAPIPIAAAEYDPSNGTYVGPDGKTYTQANLADKAPEEQTWQSMLIPPTG
jgi:phospholipid/cholesterol/gamma-HCH transport system substrate-binding protein